MIANNDLALDTAQVQALAASMLSVARVDGMQPQEDQLIRAFYVGEARPGLPPYADLPQDEAGVDRLLAAAGKDPAYAEQLVMMCLMTAYADGRCSDAERQKVQHLAQQAGVDSAQLAELQTQVKDTLIGSLAHLPDSAGVAALVKDL